MDSLSFTKEAWEQYMEWQIIDKKATAKINVLIKDIQRNGFMSGLGKPEALKTCKAYSRHIDGYHRLVYESDENQNLRIISCKGHYEE
jgi:toxin YoeB